MDSTVVALIAFTCTFGGAMLGMWLHKTLPKHHVDNDSRDTVKVGIALIATMTALVLGLITASAKSSFDGVHAAVQNTAVNVLTLDRVLARYGPETADLRKSLKHVLTTRIESVWPEDESKPPKLDPIQAGATTEAEKLVDGIRNLKPQTDLQRSLQSRAQDLTESLLQSRWIMLSGLEASVPIPFLATLMFWLTITFTSFGLFAPRNATVVAVLLVCSMSVSSAIFLVLEMDTPFAGVLKVSPTMLRYAASHINQ